VTGPAPAVPGKLTGPRLRAILARLHDGGYAPEAELLRGHVLALEDALTVQGQYYEEYVIPLIEGRPIGKSGKTWADRVRELADQGRTP
jgi:hypothetical protein